MDFDHNNVRRVVEEDGLSSLPDELLHKIMSSLDIKFVVQTCLLLSPRWKFLWTSMPCLNFASGQIGTLPKFSKFVTNVLSHRNHQVEVSSVKLNFHGAASQVFVRKIATYAFSHNVQELTVLSSPKKNNEFPPCLFSSQSLKHLTFGNNNPISFSTCVTPKTPWNFPNLTTLHLSNIKLSDCKTVEPVDIFSKCVNLKKLTLKSFVVKAVKVFDIITPRLSDLMLINGDCPNAINLIAPQLESLTIIACSIKYFNAPPGLSCFQYRDYNTLQLSKDRLHSLDEVSICLSYYGSKYKEEDARNTINMLQQLHSARYLTLNADTIECISSFPDLLSHHPSPFSNLIHLTIGASRRNNANKVKISTEARNFLIAASPDAIMRLPEELVTKEMKYKEAMVKKKAKQAAEIESHMKELQALTEKGNMVAEQKRAKENAKAAVEIESHEEKEAFSPVTLQQVLSAVEALSTKLDTSMTELNNRIEGLRSQIIKLQGAFSSPLPTQPSALTPSTSASIPADPHPLVNIQAAIASLLAEPPSSSQALILKGLIQQLQSALSASPPPSPSPFVGF